MKINNKNPKVTAAQINLLQKCALEPFTFNKFTSLDDILTRLKVEVIIETGTASMTVPPFMEETAEYWRSEYDRLRKKIQGMSDKNLRANESIREAWNEAEINMGRANIEKNLISSIPVRGLYFQKENVIKLYPDEMAQEYDGERMNELLVSTLAHETMHAYFSRPRHKKYPYVYFVEEPLAEFGMLLYLNATNIYYQWAYGDVRKQETCYKYGADLMDKYLSEGTNSPTRKYLEAYKFPIDKYAMITDLDSGNCSLPQKSRSPITINGHRVATKWQDIFSTPPRYFYDPSTKTLGLDGCWYSERRGHYKYDEYGLEIRIRLYFDIYNIDNIYLGDNFYFDHDYRIKELISTIPVTVSSKNKTYKAVNGILLFSHNNEPMLSNCGQDYYELCRNGKWGVIDSQKITKEPIEPTVPFNYDSVWSIDQNELFMVENNDLYGLVNTKGEEQVKVIYESMTINDDGTYTVEHNGVKFTIDKNGIRK